MKINSELEKKIIILTQESNKIEKKLLVEYNCEHSHHLIDKSI